MYPDKLLVGVCLEANVEGNPYREAFASFREIRSLAPADAVTRDACHAIVLTAESASVTVELGRFPRAVNARWFDPTTGETAAVPGSPFDVRRKHTFTPPGRNASGDADWVLVLQAQ